MADNPLLAAQLAPADAAAFDSFVRSSRFAAYQQDRAWASLAPRTRIRDYLYFMLRDGDAVRGAGVVRRTWLAPGIWLATLQRGPVVHDALALDAVLQALTAALREQGCCSVQLAPRVRGRDLPIMAEALRAHGFAPLPDGRQSLHSTTGIVWLDKPEDEILAGFKQRGRRQLKRAENAGVTIRPAASPADVASYQRVLDDFHASRPSYDTSGLPDAAGQARLIAALGGAMLLAELDGAVIGGHVFVRQSDEAIWLSLATSSGDPQIPRSYQLLWQGMRAARALGCIGYDLAGMPIDEPQNEEESNRMQFKNAFAPSRRLMPPMQVAALKPVRHALLFGARQIYRNSPLHRLVG